MARSDAPELDERDVEAVAAAIYALRPYEDGGEYVDGFRVSPPGILSWAQVLEFATPGPADECREIARAALTTAIGLGWGKRRDEQEDAAYAARSMQVPQEKDK